MAMNITEIRFGSGRTATGSMLYQYDYGQLLLFPDLDLPEAYEVHFASDGDAQTITMIGDADGVLVPDQLLQSPGHLKVYIYLHEGESDGETEYKALIPVIGRPEPSDLEPTPVQQDAITQAIAALNTAVTESSQSASDAAELADAAAQSAQDAAESAASIDMSNYATKAELQSEASARSLADTSLSNQIDAETQRATLAEASIRLAIPSKTSQLQNDSGYITNAPVASVNGKTGAINLSASDVGALPASTVIPSKTSDLQNDSGFLTQAPVQSVNGQTGAVTISAEGLSEDAKNALIDCFRHVAWIDSDGTQYVNALISALYELQSITAVYTQSGTVYDTDSLDDLKADLVVTANYKGGTTETVTAYTLSGALEEGTSTITVSYGGKTTAFNVVVSDSNMMVLSILDDFTDGVGYLDTSPYYQTRSNRTSYTEFDLTLDPDYTYTFEYDGSGVSLGVPYYAVGVNDAVANNENISNYKTDTGWKSSGYSFTPPINAECMRLTFNDAKNTIMSKGVTELRISKVKDSTVWEHVKTITSDKIKYGYGNNGVHPYYFSRSDRAGYVDFDIPIEFGYKYRFEAISNNHLLQIGLQFFNQNVLDAVATSSTFANGDIYDPGWQYFRCEITPPETYNSSPIRGVRLAFRTSDDSTVEEGFISSVKITRARVTE